MVFKFFKFSLLSIGLLSLNPLLGCHQRRTFAPAPSPPSPPNKPKLVKPVPPALPGRFQNIHEAYKGTYQVTGYPQSFPVQKNTMMVIAVSQGSTRANDFRYALIKAFVANGYKVKDAGILSTSTLNIHRYPATETEQSKRIEIEKPDPNSKGSIQKTTTVSQSYDYHSWSANKGMNLNLEDPTSLWAPELLAYQKLKSNYFFRVFDVRFAESEKRSITLRYKVSDQEILNYRKQVRSYNRKIEAYNDLVSEYNEEIQAYNTRHNRYKTQFKNWYQRIRILAPDRKLSKYYPSTKTHLQPQSLLSEMTAKEIDSKARETVTTNIMIGYLMVRGEVINAKNGVVEWIGELRAIVPQSKLKMDRAIIELVNQLLK